MDDDNLSFEDDRKFREIAEQNFKPKRSLPRICAEAFLISCTAVMVAGAAWLVATIISDIPH